MPVSPIQPGLNTNIRPLYNWFKQGKAELPPFAAELFAFQRLGGFKGAS